MSTVGPNVYGDSSPEGSLHQLAFDRRRTTVGFSPMGAHILGYAYTQTNLCPGGMIHA